MAGFPGFGRCARAMGGPDPPSGVGASAPRPQALAPAPGAQPAELARRADLRADSSRSSRAGGDATPIRPSIWPTC